jgi:hypothetical protein
VTARRQPPLFVVSPATDVPLSKHYSARPWRATQREMPKWTNYTSKTAYCDECVMVQHETRGEFGPRMQPRRKRMMPGGGPELKLCTRHAMAWEERDRADAR